MHGRTHPRTCKREARKLRKHARDYGHPAHYCRRGGREERERETETGRQRDRDRETEKLLSGWGNQQPLSPGKREAKREIV